MRRLRHDLNHAISAVLLLLAATAILTGIVAHLWDLNDFWYHTYAGYAMAVAALAHVALNWRSMVSYARFRVRGLRRRGERPRRPAAPARTPAPVAAAPVPRSAASIAQELVLSRRGMMAAAVGGLGGLLAGRGLRPPPVIPGGADVGVVYHEWSKPGIMDALGSVANWGEQPPLYKTYPESPRVALPPPQADGGRSAVETINARRSTRDYAGRGMTLDQLSTVLHLTGGISGERWDHARRTAPSSGALYPVEVYPVVHRVEGLAAGVYHYGVADHALELVRAGDLRGEVVRQGLMQEFLGEADVVLLLTVIYQRMRFKYQDRTYRYGLLEAGHLGQNAYLAATALGLGACGVGAFLDDAINGMLGVDGREEVAVYMLSVGTV